MRHRIKVLEDLPLHLVEQKVAEFKGHRVVAIIPSSTKQYCEREDDGEGYWYNTMNIDHVHIFLEELK